MKILAIAGVAAVLALSTGASAQQVRRTVTTHTEMHSHTGPARPHHGTHRVCTVRYDHHRKVQSCRVVRY